MINELKFGLGEIVNKGLAARVNYTFDVAVDFEGIDAKSNVVGEVEIMKTDKAFNVRIFDVSIDVELECAKSLKKFIETIKINLQEREFFIDMPKTIDDINDIFLIDKKSLEVDIREFLRQEIILHFPTIPVCYGSSNELLEKYTKAEVIENKPLSALKDLLK